MERSRRTRTKVQNQPEENTVPLDQQMRRRIKRRETEKKNDSFLSTGSTMLNLAMSDNVNGGWPKGKISTCPGQSGAGKTFVVLSSFTEACIDPAFDEYDLIFNDIERRLGFDLKKLFPPVLDRLVTPNGMFYKDIEGQEEKSGISNTIEQVEISISQLIKSGKKFVYVVDSLDALSTDEEAEKEMLRAIAAAKSKEAADKILQAHAARKAGVIHRVLRNIKGAIADTGSILIITQQLKQKQGAMTFERKWVTTGGEGPYFYSTVRPYISKGPIIKDLGCQVGITSKVMMDKNSVTGKLRDIEFDIYYDMGIDDVGSMVSFLLDQKYWKAGAWIDVEEFGLRENGKNKLVRKIEELNLEGKLKRIVQQVWDEREEKLQLGRKSRY